MGNAILYAGLSKKFHKTMNNNSKNTVFEEKLAFLSVPSLFALAPIYLLIYGGYPLNRIESIFLICVFIFAGFLVNVFFRSRDTALRLATLFAVGMASIALEFSVHLKKEFNLTLLIAFLLHIGFIFFVIFILKKLNENGRAIIGAGAAALLVSIILTATPNEPDITIKGNLPALNRPDLPPIIHVVLDEHTGIAELPPEIAIEIEGILDGFSIYPYAYSLFGYTAFSMASLLNPKLKIGDAFPLEFSDGTWKVTENYYLNFLKKKGYSVSVHQSSFVDYCKFSESVDRCFTYSLSSLKSIDGLELSVLDKFFYLARLIVPANLAPNSIRMFAPIAANSAVEDLLRLLNTNPTGKAFFVHLTIPHYPYVYDKDCKILDSNDWLLAHVPSKMPINILTEPYHNQIRCSWRNVKTIFAALSQSGIFDKAIIIIQGDHGRRYSSSGIVSDEESIEKLVPKDLFSALLAIRKPNFNSGISEKRIAIQSIVSLIDSEFEEIKFIPESTGYAICAGPGFHAKSPNPRLLPFSIEEHAKSNEMFCE